MIELIDRLKEHDLSKDLLFFIILLLVLAFIFSMARQAKRERVNRLRVEKILRELEVSHRQLQDYAEKVAELATIEERNRLARDIHDSLGHYLTVINIQLEKAMAFRDINPQAADQAVRDAKRIAGEALQDTRRSVGALRKTQEPFSLVQALTGLVSNLQNSQLSIGLEIDGCEEGFSQQLLMTLYRAAQEGLTNIQKHAEADCAEINIKFNDRQASLCIIDNGRGFDPGVPEKGGPHYGLQGVRERLELARGSFELESSPGKGTKLLITIPRNPLTLMAGDRRTV
ncbi:MAG: sensor histidine kinase [Bacillota bacterium]